MMMKSGRCLQILLVFLVQFQCMRSNDDGFNLGARDSNIISCLETERQALLKFKQGVIDDYGYLSSWGTEEEQNDCCRWSGIQCNNRTGHVVMLDLHSTFGMPLRGEISPSLFDLKHLKYLDLSRTAFNLTGVPELLGSLSKLRYLNLSRAGLAGTFPYSIGNLSSLRSLDLSYNYAIVPENLRWLSHLSSLRFLDMSLVNLSKAANWLQEINMLPSLVDLTLVFCSLNDAIPPLPSYYNISTSLSTLDLSWNSVSSSFFSTWLFNITSLVDLRLKLMFIPLQGPIPDAFGNMTSLAHVDLSFNNLEGQIPPSMWNLCSLQTVDLSVNRITQFGNMAHNLFAPCSAETLEVLSLRVNNLSGPLPDFTKFSSLRELRLDRNRFNGSIPKSFGNISKLVFLDLQENQLSGSLPHLPKSLTVLRLSYNQLNGTLTKMIGELSELIYLYVASNQFKGVISKVHLENFSKLQHLDLSSNSVAFDLSSDWVPPFQLKTLRLNSCKLGPQFPEWLQRHKNLSHLDISNNEILDTIPNWFWDLSANFGYLNLSHNQIHGMLPISSLKLVEILDLSSNHFEGPLPLISPNATFLDLSHNMFSGAISSICRSQFWTLLDLSDNLLSGGIPDCGIPMYLLNVLSLASNNLSGKIPSWMGSLPFLQTLHLQNNSLSGELPLSLKNCRLLRHINFGENRLSGKIPAWIGENLSMLIILSLNSNVFHGSLPLQLCHLTSLQILDLSHNSISGTIPWCFSNFSAMAQKKNSGDPISYGYLQANYIENVGYVGSYLENALVTWKGRRDKYEKYLGLLRVIDLSSNNLSGIIPGQITSLLGLVALNLSRNHLNGTIPETIGELTEIQSLDFSRCNLSGRIPTSLSNLNFLQYLDLSNNDLFGKIPSGTQLQSFNASAYGGNPKLCGPPLTEKCSEDEPPSKEDDIHKDGKWHGIPWHFVSAGIGFVVGFWGVCFTLVFKTSWRHAYFRFVDDVYNRLYVLVAVKVAKLQRKFQG